MFCDDMCFYEESKTADKELDKFIDILVEAWTEEEKGL